jgi:hypothetical protein
MPPRQGRHPTGARAPISREPVGLDADTIVTAALALLDEHGVAAINRLLAAFGLLPGEDAPADGTSAT